MTTLTSANEADTILAALTQQVCCYRRLAKLAEIQHEHVQNSRTEQLLEVLSQRQEVIEQIAEFERSLAPAKRRWSETVGALQPDSRAGAEQLLAEARRLLEKITIADRNDALVLQQRKLNLGRQINTATAARQINRNYALAAYGAPASSMDVRR